MTRLMKKKPMSDEEYEAARKVLNDKLTEKTTQIQDTALLQRKLVNDFHDIQRELWDLQNAWTTGELREIRGA